MSEALTRRAFLKSGLVGGAGRSWLGRWRSGQLRGLSPAAFA